MTEVNELEDFEAYLEPDFDSYRFANDLLLSTNDHNTTDLDVATSIKRLTFDVDEVEKRMTSIASNNYSSIMANFSEIESTNDRIKKEISPSIERVNHSFQKIQDEIIGPYDETVKMNSALRNIHTTLELLRGSNIFFMLISQLEELEKSVSSEDKNSKSINIIKLAKLHKQIQQLYEGERESKDTDISLLSIKLIRDYKTISLTKRHQLIENCTEVIIADCGHNSTFVPENVSLRNRLIALCIVNDREFTTVLDKATLSKQVQNASQQLTRSLQSPRNFISILKEVNVTCTEFLNKLQKILINCEVNLEDESFTNLHEKIISDQLSATLGEIFWPRLAFKFKKSVASTMARGGPIAKNLKVYYEGIRKAVLEIYGEGEMLEAVDLISKGR